MLRKDAIGIQFSNLHVNREETAVEDRCPIKLHGPRIKARTKEKCHLQSGMEKCEFERSRHCVASLFISLITFVVISCLPLASERTKKTEMRNKCQKHGQILEMMAVVCVWQPS